LQESAVANDIVHRYARLQVPRYTPYPIAADGLAFVMKVLRC
jgi:hypothetical protein